MSSHLAPLQSLYSPTRVQKWLSFDPFSTSILPRKSSQAYRRATSPEEFWHHNSAVQCTLKNREQNQILSSSSETERGKQTAMHFVVMNANSWQIEKLSSHHTFAVFKTADEDFSPRFFFNFLCDSLFPSIECALSSDSLILNLFQVRLNDFRELFSILKNVSFIRLFIQACTTMMLWKKYALPLNISWTFPYHICLQLVLYHRSTWVRPSSLRLRCARPYAFSQVEDTPKQICAM